MSIPFKIIADITEIETIAIGNSSREVARLRRSYGSGHWTKPYFEGGVGVSSHESICEGLGLNMRCITDTNMTNVYFSLITNGIILII